jgi:hypothetical protein
LLLPAQPTPILEVHLGARQFIGRPFLFHEARLLRQLRHGRQEGAKVEHTRAERRVGCAIRHHVLQVERPDAILVAVQVVHRIATAHQHIADVELEAHELRLRARQEHVERKLALVLPLVIGLVVQRQPDAGVHQSLRFTGQARHHQILMPRQLRRAQADHSLSSVSGAI